MNIYLIVFIACFMLIPLVLFILLIIFILKKSKQLSDKEKEIFIKFANDNSFRYKENISYESIRKNVEYFHVFQKKDIINTFKGMDKIETRKKITNFVEKHDDNTWNIFQCYITYQSDNVQGFLCFMIKLETASIDFFIDFVPKLIKIAEDMIGKSGLINQKQKDYIISQNAYRIEQISEIDINDYAYYRVYGNSDNKDKIHIIANFMKDNLPGFSIEIHGCTVLLYANVNIIMNDQLDKSYKNIIKLLDIINSIKME